MRPAPQTPPPHNLVNIYKMGGKGSVYLLSQNAFLSCEVYYDKIHTILVYQLYLSKDEGNHSLKLELKIIKINILGEACLKS